jgi:hypothetical protein
MSANHFYTRGADPLPPHKAMAGKIHLNEEITPPPPPTGIGERYCQTISNLGYEAQEHPL